jgi:hypothetical protein
MSNRNRAIFSSNARTVFLDPHFEDWTADFRQALLELVTEDRYVFANFEEALTYLYGAALENVIDTMDEGDEWKEYGLVSLLDGNRDSVLADITLMLPSGTWTIRDGQEAFITTDSAGA